MVYDQNTLHAFFHDKGMFLVSWGHIPAILNLGANPEYVY